MMNSSPPSARLLFANRGALRLIVTHLLTVVGEWAAIVGALVHAFEVGGATAAGLASCALFLPGLIGSPVAARLTARSRVAVVRRVGLAVQTTGFGAAWMFIGFGAPVGAVVAAVVVGLGGIAMLRPTGAVLLPCCVRSPTELAVGNLWISYSDSTSALVGPLGAAALLGLSGPGAVLGVCAGLSLVALVLSSHPGDVGPPAAGERPADGSAIVGIARQLAHRRRNVAIVAVGWARSVVLGGLQPLMVVLAFEELDMQRGGPGLLGALVGAGAVASTVATTVVARRAHLTPVLVLGLAAAAAALLALAAGVSLPAAVIALPVVGLAAALLDGLGRILLQRACDPTALGPAFALFDLAVATGFVSGAALAQAMLTAGDARLALVALAAVATMVLVASVRPLWSADHVSDVPVVEMSLLRSLPMFAPLPPLALEAVARSAHYLPVDRGEVVVRQGEHGDCFYAVVDGAFEVEMSGRPIRTARRAGFFGEVALLADVPRTATVSAVEVGELLVVERVAFLVAVTGSDTSHQVAWGIVRGLEFDTDLALDDAPEAGREA